MTLNPMSTVGGHFKKSRLGGVASVEDALHVGFGRRNLRNTEVQVQ